eukprot:scaffold4044_cov399-Prasinococcus_capsulatus_cf.AAC.19
MRSSTIEHVILAENQRKKTALTDLERRYDRLLAENQQLLKEREISRREAQDVTRFLQRDLSSKDESILRLEAKILEQREELKRERDEAISQVRRWVRRGGRLQQLRASDVSDCVRQEKKNRQALERRLAEQCNAQRAEVEDLRAQLASLREFASQRHRMEAELQQLRQQTVELQQQHEEHLTEMEQRFILQNATMKSEYQDQLQLLARSAKEDVHQRLNATVKGVLGQNQLMADELRLHTQETSLLQRKGATSEGDGGAGEHEATSETEFGATPTQRLSQAFGVLRCTSRRSGRGSARPGPKHTLCQNPKACQNPGGNG